MQAVPSGLSKCAGWYFRMRTLIWVCRRTLSALLVHRRWGNVVLVRESGTLVILRWRGGGGGDLIKKQTNANQR